MIPQLFKYLLKCYQGEFVLCALQSQAVTTPLSFPPDYCWKLHSLNGEVLASLLCLLRANGRELLLALPNGRPGALRLSLSQQKVTGVGSEAWNFPLARVTQNSCRVVVYSLTGIALCYVITSHQRQRCASFFCVIARFSVQPPHRTYIAAPQKGTQNLLI